MKDERGIYYYPFPQNHRVRMYVEERESNIWFRLWNEDDPKLWDDHGWIPYDAIKEASAMYEAKSDFDPTRAYDINIAKAVLNGL